MATKKTGSTASNVSPTGWLAEHHTLRKFLLQASIAVVGVAISMQEEITKLVPVDKATFIVLAFALLNAAYNWLKYNTDAPVVGQKSK